MSDLDGYKPKKFDFYCNHCGVKNKHFIYSCPIKKENKPQTEEGKKVEKIYNEECARNVQKYGYRKRAERRALEEDDKAYYSENARLRREYNRKRYKRRRYNRTPLPDGPKPRWME